MTEAEARALTVGAAVTDNGPGVGTVTEKHIDFFSIKWTAPPTRVEGVSTFLYEDCELLSSGAAPLPGFWLLPDTPVQALQQNAVPNAVGNQFMANAAGSIVAARFWRAAAETGTSRQIRLYKGTVIAGTTVPTVETANFEGYVQAVFPTPIAIASGNQFSIVTDVNKYSQDATTTDLHPAQATWLAGVWGPYGNMTYPPNSYVMSFMVDVRWS